MAGGMHCAAVNCNNYQRKCNGLSFFRFPKEQIRRNVWITNCRRSDLDKFCDQTSYLYENCRICADHFEDTQFMNPRLRNRLTPTAVPTIFQVPNPPLPSNDDNILLEVADTSSSPIHKLFHLAENIDNILDVGVEDMSNSHHAEIQTEFAKRESVVPTNYLGDHSYGKAPSSTSLLLTPTKRVLHHFVNKQRMEILDLNSKDKAIMPCKRPRMDDGENDAACQVMDVDLTEDCPVDLSHHRHCLVVEDDVGKENAFVDEKRKIMSLQDDLRHEETKLVLLRKIRSSQQNARSHATNGPKMAADPRTSGQPVLSDRQNGSANLKASVAVKTGAPPVVLPVPSRALLQQTSRQSPLVTPAGHQAAPGSRGADTRAREGVESRSFPGSHLQTQRQPSKPSLTSHRNEQLAAHRQVAAKQALQKQLERTLLQIPPPKPPPPTMTLVPNSTSAEFVVLLGLEEAVKAIIRLDLQARTPAGPLSDDTGVKAPYLCCRCGTDFTPLWKPDKNNPSGVVCKHCVASNRKRALKQQHTNYLKNAFVRALQKEQEMEKRLQSLDVPSNSYAKAVVGSGRIQVQTDPSRQHAAVPAAHQSRSRVSSSGAYPYDRSVVYHGKSLSSHRYPLGSKDSRSHGKTLDSRGIPFSRT